jgi:hypothetical protein
MQTIVQIAGWSLLAFASILFVGQLLAYEAGYRLASYRRSQGTAPETEGVSLFVGGLLGLLAFVLALTLSYGSARFAERRHGALEEANAIGTAWLRAEAVANPRAGAIARLLQDYARIRKAYAQAPREPVLIEKLNSQTSALQSQIWGQVSGLVRDRPDPLAVSLMSAVNDTFDASTAERLAYESEFPPQLFWLLVGMALIAMGALGYQLGLKLHKVRSLAALLAAVWTAVIVVILDMSAPRIGAIRTSVAVYDWTIQEFEGGVSVPSVTP